MIRPRYLVARWEMAARLLAAGALWALFAGPPAPAIEPPSDSAGDRRSEKAAVVLELIPFVEWPPAPRDTEKSSFVIGVLGDEAFASAIRAAATGKRMMGRPIRTRSFRNLDEVDPCAILLIGRGKARLLPVILEFLADSTGILTIGDSADFAELGGVVRLVELPDRIGFEINRDAARRADLRLSAQLLRLAERVLPPESAPGGGP